MRQLHQATEVRFLYAIRILEIETERSKCTKFRRHLVFCKLSPALPICLRIVNLSISLYTSGRSCSSFPNQRVPVWEGLRAIHCLGPPSSGLPGLGQLWSRNSPKPIRPLAFWAEIGSGVIKTKICLGHPVLGISDDEISGPEGPNSHPYVRRHVGRRPMSSYTTIPERGIPAATNSGRRRPHIYIGGPIRGAQRRVT